MTFKVKHQESQELKALEVNNDLPSAGFELRLTSDQNLREITLPSELGLTLHQMVDGDQIK